MAIETPGGGESPQSEHTLTPTVVNAGSVGAALPPPSAPPPKHDDDDEDDGDRGMLRMSFLEHLEELRKRILLSLYGVGISYLACIVFANQLWNIVSAPALDALTRLGVKPPELVITEPMEGFTVLWVKLPLLVAIFIAAPWVCYQIWSFISPGLYSKEKRLVVPFVTATGGLFIMGGLFAYYVAFRFGLTFLLGLGMGGGIRPMVTITSYFDLFMNVMLGVALVFEMPVAIFFLTLIRIASPRFLLAHSRYAILGIVILAAVITPTPDFFNLTLFAAPMILLFFVGVFASFLLVLKREGKKFPWGITLAAAAATLAIFGGITYYVLGKYGYHFVQHWPFFVK